MLSRQQALSAALVQSTIITKSSLINSQGQAITVTCLVVFQQAADAQSRRRNRYALRNPAAGLGRAGSMMSPWNTSCKKVDARPLHTMHLFSDADIIQHGTSQLQHPRLNRHGLFSRWSTSIGLGGPSQPVLTDLSGQISFICDPLRCI